MKYLRCLIDLLLIDVTSSNLFPSGKYSKSQRIIADTKINIHIKEAGATRCKDDLSDRNDSLMGQSQNAMLLLQTH